jgi:hypothetical protein
LPRLPPSPLSHCYRKGITVAWQPEAIFIWGMRVYPYLPKTEVQTTSAKSYLALLSDKAA